MDLYTYMYRTSIGNIRCVTVVQKSLWANRWNYYYIQVIHTYIYDARKNGIGRNVFTCVCIFTRVYVSKTSSLNRDNNMAWLKRWRFDVRLYSDQNARNFPQNLTWCVIVRDETTSRRTEAVAHWYAPTDTAASEIDRLYRCRQWSMTTVYNTISAHSIYTRIL